MGWVFRGDAELAQERGLAGVCLWKDGTFVLGGRGIGAGAWFGWMCLWKDETFVLRGRQTGA